MLVKICGVRRPEDAQMALKYGADAIGIILVPGRGRTVSVETAKAIRAVIPKAETPSNGLAKTQDVHKLAEQLAEKRPVLIGVFMNQPLDEILALQAEIGLDLVQLHGNEDLEICASVPVPVIKRFTPTAANFHQWSQPKHNAVLIDGEVGGTGELVDWALTKAIPESGSLFILGGGLTPANIASAAQQPGVFMVDVSSGVEKDGFKDEAAVKAFIEGAKGTRGDEGRN